MRLFELLDEWIKIGPQPFYVKSVSLELSQEDGFTMDIDFINFN